MEALRAIHEVVDSGCTVHDFMLNCIVRSLDGKSKTMQHKIVDRINATTDTSSINLADVVSEVAQSLHSVDVHGQANVSRNVRPGNERKCYNCHKPGHTPSTCTKPLPPKVAQQCTVCVAGGHATVYPWYVHADADCPSKRKGGKGGKGRSKANVAMDAVAAVPASESVPTPVPSVPAVPESQALYSSAQVSAMPIIVFIRITEVELSHHQILSSVLFTFLHKGHEVFRTLDLSVLRFSSLRLCCPLLSDDRTPLSTQFCCLTS